MSGALVKSALSAFIVGVVFAIGLVIAGMTDASKVVGFLNVADWDPSLAFVMAGAIGVHVVLYRVILKRKSPLFGERFRLPTAKEIDAKLIVGASLFGIGWGLSGFCPGPVLVSAVTLVPDVLLFLVAMFAGMAVYRVATR